MALTRKALIIGAPDNEIPGVLKDMANYRAFLLSPAGGAWREDEIILLENPTKLNLLTHQMLMKSADYTLTVFAGHGRRPKGSPYTVLSINTTTEINHTTLLTEARKQTLILDCCRLNRGEPIMESAGMEHFAAVVEKADPALCRIAYDQAISGCPAGPVVLFACSDDEVARETRSRGGVYSSSLLDAARDWASTRARTLYRGTEVLSVLDAHNGAESVVLELTGRTQHIDAQVPRSGPYFPFAVVAKG